MSTHITPAQFERRYRDQPDPWSYRSSSYERAKYEATLHACGPGPFRSALELGGSIGVFSAMLAPRCRRLATLDAAPTAVRAARAALKPHQQARALLGLIPSAIPAGSVDLVVASEVLYYLQPAALQETFERLSEQLLPAGRLVAVHWRPTGPERPFSAESIHRLLRGLPWLREAESCDTADYLLTAFVRS